LGMEKTVKLKFVEGKLIERYPWKLLKEVGDLVIVESPFLQPLDVANAAYAYAKRHKMKIATRKLARPETRAVACMRIE